TIGWRVPAGTCCCPLSTPEGLETYIFNSAAWSPRQFLAQWTYECRFSNAMGQEQVHFFDRYIYDRQEIVHFDSTLGRYEAVTPLGEPAANYWNSQKELVHYKRSEVDRFCRHNFQILGTLAHARRVQPTVTISPTKDDPLSPHTLLLCTAASFYPQEIEIRWLKNGRRATEGVFYGEELHNGDWTYQTQVMLEDTPQRGDIYACQVEHSSLETLLTVQWEPRTSESARRKVWMGIVGALLGLVFVTVGLTCYLRSKKGKGALEGKSSAAFALRSCFGPQEAAPPSMY
uniref:Ig-like domain-containing protein n=1 Tax=Varanus komodoensis TaxID=61221 RepID=A0A8D2LSJ9_VARKO